MACCCSKPTPPSAATCSLWQPRHTCVPFLGGAPTPDCRHSHSHGSSRRRERRAAADRRAWLTGSEAVFLLHPVTPERGQAACGRARPGSPTHNLHTMQAGAALHLKPLVLDFMLTSVSPPFCSKVQGSAYFTTLVIKASMMVL